MKCTLQRSGQKTNLHLRRRKERATGSDDCRRVSVKGVQKYSVQCKGYNLIGVTTVEVSAARGTTALVY
jgi:hypothetical protein